MADSTRQQTYEDCVRLMTERTRRNDQTGCLIWTKHVQAGGYGTIKADGQYHKTHRFAWLIAYGPIPAGMHVCHTCDNRRCCEPTHLFLGTNQDNILDKAMKGRAGKKLTPRDVIEIREMLDAGCLQQEIAELFGVNQSSISYIKTGRNWPYSYEGRV